MEPLCETCPLAEAFRRIENAIHIVMRICSSSMMARLCYLYSLAALMAVRDEAYEERICPRYHKRLDDRLQA